MNGPSSYSFNAFRCLGGVYVFGGDSLFATGTYIDTLGGAASTGCDSIVTLNLLVSSPTYRFDTVAICSPATYAFNGQLLNASGLYLDTVSGNAPGVCDTIVNLILRVNNPSTSTITAQICANGSYLFNGRILRTAGTYTDTLTNAANCDSIVTLNLSIGALATASVSITICAPNSYAFDGRSLTATGVYIDTISGSSGACDTIVTLNLTVNQPSATTLNETICSPTTYSFNGQTLSTSGTYTATLTNAAGCDSVITLNLTVNQPSATTINQTICSPTTYSFDGQLLSVTGIYRDTLTNAAGCDSVITLNLSVGQHNDSILNLSICDPDSFLFNNLYLSVSGTYLDTLTNITGCDSVVTLVLTVNRYLPSDTTVSDTICAPHPGQIGGYSFKNRLLTITGTYQDTFVNVFGCDSVTSVTGSAPVNSSGGSTPAISLASGYGDTQNPYASKTANYVLASPNGSSGVPTFRALVAADVPTLNQNTTGTAASIASGAANQLLYQSGASTTTFATAPTVSGTYLKWNGSAFAWDTPAGTGDVVGPASATDNAITRFDTTTGKLIQNSLVTIDDTGVITAPAEQ